MLTNKKTLFDKMFVECLKNSEHKLGVFGQYKSRLQPEKSDVSPGQPTSQATNNQACLNE
jgi:hypothetical protein